MNRAFTLPEEIVLSVADRLIEQENEIFLRVCAKHGIDFTNPQHRNRLSAAESDTYKMLNIDGKTVLSISKKVETKEVNGVWSATKDYIEFE